MNQCDIILKGFNNLFAQWLNEKLNCEEGIKCLIWRDAMMPEIETNTTKKLLIIHQFRNRNEIDQFKQINYSGRNILIVGWWNGDTISEEDIFSTLNKGISALISEGQDWDEILEALYDVNENSFHYNRLVSRALFHLCRKRSPTQSNINEPSNSLAEREKKIIELRQSGKTAKEIGEVLFLSKKTIDKLFGDLYQRFDCSNFFELLIACDFNQSKKSFLDTQR